MKTGFVGVVTGKRRAVLFIVVGIALFVLAIGGGIALRMARNNDATPSMTNTPTKTLPKAAASAQDAALSGNYDDAHKQINQALNQQNLSGSDKYALYYQQGVTYQNEGKYQQAIDSYKQAEAAQETQSLAESIGDTYVALGSKDNAISYYKRAIQLIPSDSPVGGDDKSALEQKIRDLGGQP